MRTATSLSSPARASDIDSLHRARLEHRQESLIAIREFLWAEGDALSAILELRRRYRTAFEELLTEGATQGRMAVANPKSAAFAIIEMAESVPRWFRPGGDTSINQLAYLYGEFALRIAGV
jgi:Tetracyclin repressor-like, C-terminal domain